MTKNETGFLNLDEIESEARGTFAPFAIRVGGKKLEVPNAQSLSGDQAERMDAGDRRSVMVELIGEDHTAAIWGMPAHVITRFINAWLAHGGTKPGEGQASTDS